MNSRLRDIDGPPGERTFDALREVYARTGGVGRAEDLAHMLDDLCRGDFITLARHIAMGDVFALRWRDELWVPMFQFDLNDLAVRRSVAQVRAELEPSLDGWGLAAWFARPNAWLEGNRPVDWLEGHLPNVLEAARADRFVATC